MKRFAYPLAGSALVAGAFASCMGDPRYVYTAQRFDVAGGCLEEYRAIETLPGDRVSVRCAPRCMTVDEDLYVSVVCPPLPANATLVEADAPECLAALDAARLEASCEAPAEEDGDGGGGDDAETDGAPNDDGAADADSRPPEDAGDASAGG